MHLRKRLSARLPEQMDLVEPSRDRSVRVMSDIPMQPSRHRMVRRIPQPWQITGVNELRNPAIVQT